MQFSGFVLFSHEFGQNCVVKMYKFDGKVVIVTGASSGIGASTAIAFAKAGAKLTICGRNVERLEKTAKLCREKGSEVLQIIGDLTEYENIEPIINKTVEKYSRIDILINNAGIAIIGPTEDLKIDEFDTTYKVLVRAPVFLCKFAVPYLKQSKGCVVNVSSMLGIKILDFATHYGMFKSALDHFTRGFAAECSRFGVRVNSINPGVVKTPMLYPDVPIEGSDVIIEKFRKMSLLGFMEPETISDGIMFLCSSQHITGTTLVIDSGVIIS